MSTFEKILLGGMLLSIISKLALDAQRNLLEKKKNTLAGIAGMVGRAAGRIAGILNGADSATDVTQLRQRIIKAEAESIMNEFDPKGKVVGASVPKVSGMIDGELDRLLTSAPVPAKVDSLPVSPAIATETALRDAEKGVSAVRDLTSRG